MSQRQPATPDLRVSMLITVLVFLFSTSPPALAGTVTPLTPDTAHRADRVKPLPAETNDDSDEGQWVTVEGYSPMDAGKSVARKQALLSAYRRAVNAGGSIEIGEFSQLHNFKNVVDIVTKRSHGFIREYELLAEGPDSDRPNQYMVAIRALVVDDLERSDDQAYALRQFVQIIGSPKVLFLLAENPAKDSANGSNQSKVREKAAIEVESEDTRVSVRKESSASTETDNSAAQAADQPYVSTAEHEMAKHFRAVGYEVLTSDDVRGRGFISGENLAKARRGMGSYAAKVGQAVKADVVIAGITKYHVSAMSGGTDVDAHVGTVNLSAKAVMPSKGRVLHVATSRTRFMSAQHSSALMAREESVARASKVVATELMWEIPKLLSRQTRDITLSIDNISYERADELRQLLATLTGVDSVVMQGWQDKQSRYTVRTIFTGPREHDLVGALRPQLNGFEVDRVSPYRIVAHLNN